MSTCPALALFIVVTIKRDREPDRQYTFIPMRGNNGLSLYNALNVALRSNHVGRTGLSYTLNYTWAHTIDNLSSTFSESTTALILAYDPLNPRLTTAATPILTCVTVLSPAPSGRSPSFQSSHRLLRNALGGDFGQNARRRHMCSMFTDTVDLLFDWSDYGRGDNVSAGARILAGHVDNRRRDFWILRDRQTHKRDRAQDHEHDRYHRRKYRPVNEKM